MNSLGPNGGQPGGEKQIGVNEVVNEKADDVKERSHEIKIATQEQKTAVNEIVNSITNMNDLIQTSASGIEEIVGTAEGVSRITQSLKDKVDFFKV